MIDTTAAGLSPADLDEQTAATAALVTATRRVMEAAATSEVDPVDAQEISAELNRLAASLEGRRRPGVRRIPFTSEMVARVRAGDRWQFFPFNPFGYPLSITVEGGHAHAELVPGPLLEGPPGLLHGGFATALMDALLGTMVRVEVDFAYTARLDVHFRRGTELGRPVRLGARVLSVEGRKVHAEGWIDQDGVRTVEAFGLFVRVDPGEPRPRPA
jgi:acyl-coenzyme A thioesterase PaaI-like protein